MDKKYFLLNFSRSKMNFVIRLVSLGGFIYFVVFKSVISFILIGLNNE
jgi:hypothetical protein